MAGFKVLATIGAWVLWICGMVMGFSSLALGIMAGDIYNPDVVMPVEYCISFAVALGYGIGSVVVMRLRQKMD